MTAGLTGGVVQIHGDNLVALPDGIGIVLQSSGCQLLKLRHEHQETAEPHFMPTVQQQRGHLAQWEVSTGGTHYLARLRHLQSQKLITVTVLTGCCLEEPHEYCALLVIA